MASNLSIIIPTLNEENTLESTLHSIDRECEVVVVDGGSRDRTLEIADKWGCNCLSSSPGRAKQMNTGAAAASGDILVFLHADTLLPTGFIPAIVETLSNSTTALGAFSLGFNSSDKGLRFIAWCANLRSTFLKLPYGDQALFTTRELYHQVGGFPEIEIMEDYVFVKIMQKRGRIVTLSQPVTTSPRRWQNMGIIKTTLINQAIVLGFNLGISPRNLCRLYQRLRGL